MEAVTAAFHALFSGLMVASIMLRENRKVKISPSNCST